MKKQQIQKQSREAMWLNSPSGDSSGLLKCKLNCKLTYIEVPLTSPSSSGRGSTHTQLDPLEKAWHQDFCNISELRSHSGYRRGTWAAFCSWAAVGRATQPLSLSSLLYKMRMTIPASWGYCECQYFYQWYQSLDIYCSGLLGYVISFICHREGVNIISWSLCKWRNSDLG